MVRELFELEAMQLIDCGANWLTAEEYVSAINKSCGSHLVSTEDISSLMRV